MVEDAQSWREQRRRAVEAHAAAADRERSAALSEARRLLADFVQEATRRGIPPQRLRARVPDRRTSYRTNLTGWYLRRNGSLAVDVNGGFYHLEVPPRLSSRIVGARITASEPPLRVGVGARDGESMPLARLLQLRLEAGAW